MNTQTTNENPLGTQPVKKLLMQFAIPSIVAMLVSSLYNIVDQFFIGRNVGELGNAATNISFPLSISCIAIALLFGIGGASAFNLAMGKGEKEKAVYYIGNSAVMLFGCGVILTTITLLFLASAPFLWISRQCTFLCKNLHRHCCDRFSFSDPHDRKRSSDPGRWQTKD